MSNWSKALSGWMKRNNVNGVQAGEATGISESIWSRWLSGNQLSVSAAHWKKICATLVTNPNDRAEMLKAILLDRAAIMGPGMDQISMRTKIKGPKG